jgi:hypothetical protein
MSKPTPKVEIRLTLEGEMARRFQELKRRWGFESNTDLLRMLITRAYHQEIPYKE